MIVNLASVLILFVNEKLTLIIGNWHCYFQAKVGGNKKFQAELRRLRGKDADITQEAAEIQVCLVSSLLCVAGVGI